MAKSTTTTSYFDPETTSSKTADFAHWQAEFTRAFADFSKLWSNPKASNLDVNWLLTYQRKNFEALTAANQRAFEGVQAFAKAQAEFVREAAEELQKVAKELVGAGSPEDKLVKQAVQDGGRSYGAVGVSTPAMGEARRGERQHRRNRMADRPRTDRGAAGREAEHRQQRQRGPDGERWRARLHRRDERSAVPLLP